MGNIEVELNISLLQLWNRTIGHFHNITPTSTEKDTKQASYVLQTWGL
jgi:hypothetical protein